MVSLVSPCSLVSFIEGSAEIPSPYDFGNRTFGMWSQTLQ